MPRLFKFRAWRPALNRVAAASESADAALVDARPLVDSERLSETSVDVQRWESEGGATDPLRDGPS